MTTPQNNEIDSEDDVEKLTEKKGIVSVVLYTPNEETDAFKAFSRASQIDYGNVEYFHVTNADLVKKMDLGASGSQVFLYRPVGFESNLLNCQLETVTASAVRQCILVSRKPLIMKYAMRNIRLMVEKGTINVWLYRDSDKDNQASNDAEQILNEVSQKLRNKVMCVIGNEKNAKSRAMKEIIGERSVSTFPEVFVLIPKGDTFTKYRLNKDITVNNIV
jgi:hypothetical protein